MTRPIERNPPMIVYSGLRKVFKIMAATAHSCCDPVDVCREAVEDCKRFGYGIDLSYRGEIIEVRPHSDPAHLAAAIEGRAAEQAKPARHTHPAERSSDAAHSRNSRP